MFVLCLSDLDGFFSFAGAYMACGGGGAAYLWVVATSAAGSVSYVLAKAAAAVLPRRGVAPAPEGKGPEPMLLLSVALAAAHLAVAYRTSCRERRRLLVYRIDVEAVSTLPLSLCFKSEIFSITIHA